MIENIAHKYSSLTLPVLRIITGFLFFPHGAQKLFGWWGGMGGAGTVATFPQLPWFAGVVEFFGGLLILLGVFTRPVAFLLCGEMAVAYFKAHAPPRVHAAGEPRGAGRPVLLRLPLSHDGRGWIVRARADVAEARQMTPSI